MKKKLACLCVVLALTLGVALVPALTSAAEFSFAGPPAFTVTYPDGTDDEKTSPEQVLRIKTGAGLVVDVAVAPIPEGIALKDYAEKSYKPGLEKAVGANAKMGDNKEITLADGTKAYYSEMDWNHAPSGGTLITTMVVSAYKDGKVVYVDAHPWDNYNVATKIVMSLKFK
ncbi:MAG: hypothetical protein HY787_28405 [Deltaproteobacteria bacterium]|nr:hypothetical protein [Deltaproteobacteria bacterium]